MRATLAKVLGASALGALSLVAHAQPFPSKPIRIIVPYAAAGPTDAVARGLATKLSEQFGQPVVVENRLGAGGNVGSDAVAKAPADGYTLLYQSAGIATAPALSKSLPYDPVKDLAPVAMTATIPLVIVANAQLPATSIEQFLAFVKANPSKANYGSGGAGSIPHLALAVYLQNNGVKATHVPYKGTAAAMTDLIGGQIQFLLDAVSTQLPFIADNRVRPMAVTSATRSQVLPNVPTVGETTNPNFSATTWHGLFAPAGTPQSVIAQLNAAANKAMADADMKAKFAPQGVQLMTSTPEQLGSHLRTEVDRWTKAAAAAGVKPD